MRLDSHQHFWHYNSAEHVWMSDQMGSLKRDFLPTDLQPLLSAMGFDGSVSVQARQNLEETEWLLELADTYDYIVGVVGWVDLCSEELPKQLERFAKNPKLVGVRHVIHDEPDDSFMLRPDFRRGISRLRDFDLTYDLLLFPDHILRAVKLAGEFPEQPFVLDHIAKPRIADGLLSPWREDLIELAKFPNVFCKLSGMVTEAKWRNWQSSNFYRYLDVVFEAFGADRVMIGSDWPVCTLSGDYESTMTIVLDYIQQFPLPICAGILGENCSHFYRIETEKTKDSK